MEKLTAKLSESILDKFSMDFLRNQVLKNAYGNDDTVIAALDPRILLAWYLFFGLVPWFVNDIPFLLGCFLLVMATTILARVAGLVLFLFALGVFSQTGYLFLVTLLFGGDASAVAPLLILTLKVATISLASVTVFSGLDPDKLSNGLMWYGCPERLSFSISYAYRMLPMLMEEFQNVLLSYRQMCIRDRLGMAPRTPDSAVSGISPKALAVCAVGFVCAIVAELAATAGMSLIDWEAEWAESGTAMAVGMVAAAAVAIIALLVIKKNAGKKAAVN